MHHGTKELKNEEGEALAIEVAECRIELIVRVSDASSFIRVPLSIILYNSQPYLNRRIHGLPGNWGASSPIFVQLSDTLDWAFEADTFRDIDTVNDTLVYRVQWRRTGQNRLSDLPRWFSFLNDTRRFYAQMRNSLTLPDYAAARTSSQVAIPDVDAGAAGLTLTQLRYCFDLVVTASDGHETASADLQIIVYDNQPYRNRAVTASLWPPAIHFGQSFVVPLDPDSFKDMDHLDVLQYSVRVNGTRISQISWLFFNANKMNLRGTAAFAGFRETCTQSDRGGWNPDALPASEQAAIRYCSFEVDVTASDGELSARQSFIFRVYDQMPLQALPLPLLTHHISQYLEYAVQPGTFVDMDGDALGVHAEMEDPAQAWPAWLRFSVQPRKFSG